MAPADDRACPGCAGRTLASWLEVGSFAYVECLSCGLVTLDPRQVESPGDLFTQEYFDSGAHSGYTDYAADEPTHRLNARRHLDRLSRLKLRPPGMLLDVGCAAGFFMSEAARRGWTVAGVDVSSWSRDQAKRRFGYEVYSSVEEAADRSSSRFDVVTAFQVLEHVSDVRAILGWIRGALQPRGMLLVETWNRASLTSRLLGRHWPQLSPPSVVHLFDTPSLKRLLKSCGFREAPLRPMSKFVSAAWVAGLVGSKTRVRLASKLAEAQWLRSVSLPYVFDDLTCLATTPDN
jgi:SAM-dependent methyltransferase